MDIVSRIADLGYDATHGLPAYWGNDQSGILPKAVSRLMAYGAGEATEPEEDQTQWLIEYLQYHIAAPCWDAVDHDGEIAALRKKALELKTVDDIMHYVELALESAIDPF